MSFLRAIAATTDFGTSNTPALSGPVRCTTVPPFRAPYAPSSRRMGCRGPDAPASLLSVPCTCHTCGSCTISEQDLPEPKNVPQPTTSAAYLNTAGGQVDTSVPEPSLRKWATGRSDAARIHTLRARLPSNRFSRTSEIRSSRLIPTNNESSGLPIRSATNALPHGNTWSVAGRTTTAGRSALPDMIYYMYERQEYYLQYGIYIINVEG